jgi:MFS superfamily sulfate permease-like transporter
MVTIFAMLMPQGMAYSELAGVAPVAGLYTAIGALVGLCAFLEFTTSGDWYRGIFSDPGGYNGCC